MTWNLRDHWNLALWLLRWLALAVPLGTAVGSACAFFIWSLEKVTQVRFQHSWLLFLLPLAGVAMQLTYDTWGKRAAAGNNLLMDEIHQPGGGVPLRMAPLILVATLVTHLFGGSAGREGTAVQMGGSLAAGWGRMLRLNSQETRILLMCGIAAGFGGVFGTPLAGAVFALEVLVIGRISYEGLIPCLLAAVSGDWACRAWGIHHEANTITAAGLPNLAPDNVASWLLMGKVMLAALFFALASVLFGNAVHGVQALCSHIKVRWLRPVLGALTIICLTLILGDDSYLGLGVAPHHPGQVAILTCFDPGGAQWSSWFWKLAFTAITLGSGFKGGEVTPLFFVGAALGHWLGTLLGAPVDLFAGLGFVAVFCGATNTPLACTLLGIELFGAEYSLLFMVVCFISYLMSGHTGIYSSQRIGTPKSPFPENEWDPQDPPATLKSWGQSGGANSPGK